MEKAEESKRLSNCRAVPFFSIVELIYVAPSRGTLAHSSLINSGYKGFRKTRASYNPPPIQLFEIKYFSNSHFRSLVILPCFMQ